MSWAPRYRRQGRPSNKMTHLTCAFCPKLVQGFILLSVGIVAVSSSNIRASPASSRQSPMDLCLHPPSHMCPLTSLCLCYTRLVIFEPFIQRNCPVAYMSCLIYCFPSYPWVTALFLVLLCVSIARSLSAFCGPSFSCGFCCSRLPGGSSPFVSFPTEPSVSTCRT